MIEIPDIPKLRPEPPRDRWGNYRLPDPDSGRLRTWTRATTLTKAVTDEAGLVTWKKRKLAQGLARRPELLADIDAMVEHVENGDLGPDDDTRTRLAERLDEAHDVAGGNFGRLWGDAFHSVTEWDDVGRLDDIGGVPEIMAPHLDAYRKALADAGMEVVHIEKGVLNRAVQAAGTFDRLVRFRGSTELFLIDIKSTKSYRYGYLEPACQLAIYANAEHLVVDFESGELAPMPPVNREIGWLIQIPYATAKATFHEINLTRGWRYAQLAREVREARFDAKAAGTACPPPRPRPGGGDQLLYLIRNAASPQALDGLWRAERGRWTDAHIEAARARKAELTAV